MASAQVRASLPSPQSDYSLLPEEDEFIATLLADDDSDAFTVPDILTESRFGGNESKSPASVREIGCFSSHPKRRKVIENDLNVVAPLPLPLQQPIWNRPVCTFLNYLGSTRQQQTKISETSTARVAQKQELKGSPLQVASTTLPASSKAQTISSCKPTSAPTPAILFPVCPCKLRQMCYDKGKTVPPPIFQLLASTSTCKPVLLPLALIETLQETGDEVIKDNPNGKFVTARIPGGDVHHCQETTSAHDEIDLG